MTRIETAADLGQFIAQERHRQGYTQAELAAFSGVGVTYLSNLENGKATAELGRALGVLATLGIDLFATPRSAS